MKTYSFCIKKQLVRLLLFSCLLCGCFQSCIKAYDIVADINPPDEVTGLQIDKQEVDVRLTWQDPRDNDFKAVRISLYNSDNQSLVRYADVLPDTMYYVLETLSPGNYYVRVQTRDKENNLSDGIETPFVFLSHAPVNVRQISAQIHWNVLHLKWAKLTQDDFITTVEGQSISIPVDSIIVEVQVDSLGIDTLQRRYVLSPLDTGLVIADLPDGRHSFRLKTHGESGYYSTVYQQTIGRIDFGERFVRVQGNGHDFYIAKYEVTTEEARKFIVDDLGIREAEAPYRVDNVKVESDKWFKWWYGNNPQNPGVMKLLGFNTFEFTLDANGWASNRYTPDATFGRITWEGAMLYSLLKYNGRCPTSEEWLYAARGGALSQGYDYAGSHDPEEVGWWGWVAGTPSFLRPPGQKKPNELGIYDMSGNASEILYDLTPAGANSLGTVSIIGGSYGPTGFWGNEPEDFAPGNNIKPKLNEPAIVKHTGAQITTAFWRMGIRVLIPHSEIVKPPVNRFLYER